AACAAMVLDYLGLKYDYTKIAKALNIHAGGAAAANLRNLERMGVHVLLDHGDMQQLAASLEQNEPCIAFVMTGELPYWDFSTPHAVVVVGLDQESVYLNDPAEEVAPQVVTRTQFE